MNQTLLSSFGTPFERVENALAALPNGSVVLASGPLTPEGQLPTDTSAWVVQ